MFHIQSTVSKVSSSVSKSGLRLIAVAKSSKSDSEYSDTDSESQLHLPVKKFKNDIDSSDTEVESESDTSENFAMARKSALTPQMKMLLNVNVRHVRG